MSVKMFGRCRGLVVASIVCSLVVTSPANACTAQYDDGGPEIGYREDPGSPAVHQFKKTLPVSGTILAVPSAVPVTYLEVWASRISGYTATIDHKLLVNGRTALNFSADAEWSANPFARLEFDPALLRVGENTFEIVVTGIFMPATLKYNVDTHSNYGRSTIVAGGITRPGELMWRLNAPTTNVGAC